MCSCYIGFSCFLLEKIAVFADDAWEREYKENLVVTENIYSTLISFEEHNLTENPNYAYALYDMGLCYYHWGLEFKNSSEEKFQKSSTEYLLNAVKYLSEALTLNMKKRGELANDTIDNQEYLGDVYAALERYGEASNAYMSVISMLKNLKVKKKMLF